MNNETHANKSGEQSQNTINNAWQKMAKDAEAFENKKGYNNQNYPKNEILEQKEIDNRCIQTIRHLLNSESFNPCKNFDTLEQYAGDRAKRLGANKKINLYLCYEYWTKTNEHSSGLAKIRFNPKTESVYHGKWQFGTRAYHDPKEGTFIDFKATMNSDARMPLEKQRKSLTGFEMISTIIDYAYTCEHELTHDIQQQRIDTKEISFDALRTARDHVALRCLSAIKDGNYFYRNAHNDFFIETEANDAADDFLSEIISTNNLISSKISNPNDSKEYQKTVGEVFIMRSQEARMGQGIIHKLSTKGTSLKIPKKDYSGTAEDIVSDLCDDAIKTYPGFLSEYPVLLLEYNKDGSRKSREDIEAALNSINDESNTTFNGKEIDSKHLRIAYYKLLKNSKKLSKTE